MTMMDVDAVTRGVLSLVDAAYQRGVLQAPSYRHLLEDSLRDFLTLAMKETPNGHPYDDYRIEAARALLKRIDQPSSPSAQETP